MTTELKNFTASLLLNQECHKFLTNIDIQEHKLERIIYDYLNLYNDYSFTELKKYILEIRTFSILTDFYEEDVIRFIDIGIDNLIENYVEYSGNFVYFNTEEIIRDYLELIENNLKREYYIDSIKIIAEKINNIFKNEKEF